MEAKMHRQATSGKSFLYSSVKYSSILQFPEVSLVLEMYEVRKLTILPISQRYFMYSFTFSYANTKCIHLLVSVRIKPDFQYQKSEK